MMLVQTLCEVEQDRAHEHDDADNKYRANNVRASVAADVLHYPVEAHGGRKYQCAPQHAYGNNDHHEQGDSAKAGKEAKERVTVEPIGRLLQSPAIIGASGAACH